MSKTIITLTGSGTRSGISFTSGVRYKVTSDMLTKLTVQDLVAMSASVFYQDGSTESISNLSAKNNWKLMQHGASATKSLMDVTAQWQTVAGGTNDNVDTGDFNNLLKTGFYRGSSMANAPVSNSGWWYITVQAHHDGNWVHQTAYLYGPSFASGVSSYDMFVRTMDAGSWGPWRRIWNETNFDPSSKSAVTHAHSAVDLDGNMAIDYSNSDLNSLSGNASYRGTNMSSAPDSGWWWIDSRRHTNQDWMNQLAFPFGTGAGNSSDQNIYWRKKSAGGWQDWQRLVTSGNLTTFSHVMQKSSGVTMTGMYLSNTQGVFTNENTIRSTDYPSVGNGLLITQSVGYGSAHTFQTHMWYSGPIYYRRIVNGNSVEQWVQYLDSENGIRTKPNTSISPTSNGEMVFELTSNTQLKIKVKGSDGVVRTASLTLS